MIKFRVCTAVTYMDNIFQKVGGGEKEKRLYLYLREIISMFPAMAKITFDAGKRDDWFHGERRI